MRNHLPVTAVTVHTGARALAAVLVLALSAALGACASGAIATPTEVTRQQIALLAAGDEGGALALLAPDVRVRAPQWPAADALPSPGSVVEVERTAEWPGGLELVRTDAGWVIRRGVLALFRVDSAEGALVALGRALEAKDLGLVLSLMPEESRRAMPPGALERSFSVRAAAWRALGEAIAAGQVTWAVREGDRAEAVVVVGPGGPGGTERRVVLVREATGWKVFDVQPWTEYIAP